MKLTMDAAALAKAAKLAAAIVERRNTIPILGCVLISADADAASVTLRTSDMDCEVSLALPCTVEAGGEAAVSAVEFAGLIAKAAKVKGAQVELSADDGKLAVYSGRSKFTLATNANHAEFPAFPAWDATESWEGEASGYADFHATGVDMGESTPAKFAKVAKFVGASAAQFARRDGEDGPDRYRMTTYANMKGKVFVTFETKLAAPQFSYSYRSARPAFTFERDDARCDDAKRYLGGLRKALGLPTVGDDCGDLVYRDGLAIGLTVGKGFHDYAENRYLEDWAPPAGTLVVDGCCEVDGVEYVNLQHDCGPGMPAGAWRWRYVPEQSGFQYPVGSYSLPMPHGERRVVSAMVCEVDGGQPEPIGLNTSGNINLTAARVAELCGPIDPTTFVDMTPLAFHHGRVIATGEAALRFNALQAEHRKRLRKIAKAPRTPERLELYAAECAQFAPVIAALIEGADVTDAAIEAAGGLPAEAIALDAVADAPAVDCTEVMSEPVAEAAADPADDDALVQLLADCAPAVPDAMERRLARLEAALGIVDQAKRTPAHAASIRRAWKARKRARTAEAVQAVVANSMSAANGENRRLKERVDGLEAAFAGERAELVAEIDRLRTSLVRESEGLEHNAQRALQLSASRDRIVRRGVKLRLEIARTRAERDGLAANLQAMSRRAASDAALLDRLQPRDAAPRIILNVR